MLYKKNLRAAQEHMDEGESLFFAKQLEWVNTTLFQVQYPLLKAREVFPVNNRPDPGAQTLTYYMYDWVGMAKIIADYADDIPRVDVKGEAKTAIVRTLGDSYGWNINEIRAARYAGVNLESMKAEAARRAIMALENQIAFKGDANYNIPSFLGHPNIPVEDVPADGQGGNTEFSTKTADQILRDMNALVNSIPVLTNNVHAPTDLLLPLEQYTLISTLRIPDTNITVLNFFLQSSPFIKNVTWIQELDNPFGDGLDYMVAYEKSPSVLELYIPGDFESLPVQVRGLEFITICQERIAGTLVRFPLAIAFARGI